MLTKQPCNYHQPIPSSYIPSNKANRMQRDHLTNTPHLKTTDPASQPHVPRRGAGTGFYLLLPTSLLLPLPRTHAILRSHPAVGEMGERQHGGGRVTSKADADRRMHAWYIYIYINNNKSCLGRRLPRWMHGVARAETSMISAAGSRHHHHLPLSARNR